jgi:hypothetical protein
MSAHKLPENKVRKERPIRFSDLEWTAIKKVAKYNDMPASAWVRNEMLPIVFDEVRALKEYNDKAFTKTFISNLFES